MQDIVSIYETAKNGHKLLDDLQRLEAGVISELTDDLIDTISHIKYKYNRPVLEECMICHSDLMLLHHIKSYNAPRRYNGETRNYDRVLGLAWICPNCHYRIHNRINPYFLK